MQGELPLNIQPDLTSDQHDRSQLLKKISEHRKKIFIYDSSSADEMYFKTRIINYLNDKDEPTLTKVCWDMTWIRNNEGKFSKYLYFNERHQRLYLDYDFWEWAKATCQLLNIVLTKLAAS